MFDSTRLISIFSTHSVPLATLHLQDDTGAVVIANSTIRHWKLIGVVRDDQDVVFFNYQGDLTFYVQEPVLEIGGCLEAD